MSQVIKVNSGLSGLVQQLWEWFMGTSAYRSAHDPDFERLQEAFPHSVVAEVSVNAVESLAPLMELSVEPASERDILELLAEVPWGSIGQLQAAHDFTTPQSEGETVVVLNRTYYSLSEVLALLHRFVEGGSSDLVRSATRASCFLISEVFANDRVLFDLKDEEAWLRENYAEYSDGDREEQVQDSLNGRRADNRLILAFRRSLDFEALFDESVKTLSLALEKGVEREEIFRLLRLNSPHALFWRSRFENTPQLT